MFTRSPSFASVLVVSVAGASVLALPATAAADGPPGALELSVRAGGHFPQLVNPLGTSFDGIVKVGYGVTGDRRLQLFVELGYTQPAKTSSATDPRLAEMGASYRSTLTVHDLSNTVGATYFIPAGQSWLLPYAGAGLQIHYLRSLEVASTEGGVVLGDHREAATRTGATVFGGAGFRLGPGLVLGELRFGYAPVSQRVTGTGNIGALSVLLGYGVIL